MIIKKSKSNKSVPLQYIQEPASAPVEHRQDPEPIEQEVYQEQDNNYHDQYESGKLNNPQDDDDPFADDFDQSKYLNEEFPEFNGGSKPDYTAPNLNIPSFEDRKERRRGDRRSGYRRVEDRNLISRAHEECNAIKEGAAKEGFDYGLDRARQEISNLTGAIAQFLKAKELALDSVAPEIALLAIKVAEKIIKTEISCDETIVLNIVSEVLKSVGKEESRIVIKTNPADTTIVRENLPTVFPYNGLDTKILVVDDNDVDWGSCIIETNNGMIDATFTTQLKVLEKAFKVNI